MSETVLQTALITPVTSDGELDENALDRLVPRILAAETLGFSILGSTGEGASASLNLRRQMREAVLKRVGGHREVYSGIISTVPDEIRRDVDACRDLPLTGLLIPPPAYYPLDSQDLEQFYRELADFVPVPIMLYNIPPYTKVSIPPETVAKLAVHPNIMGIKDSSRDLDYYLRVLHLTQSVPGFKVLIGTDTLILPALAAGGHGAVVASGNIVPEWIADLVHSAKRGDFSHARVIESQLIELANALGRADGIRGFKFAAAAIDRHQGCLIAPYHALDKESPAALAILDVLKRYHLIS